MAIAAVAESGGTLDLEDFGGQRCCKVMILMRA